MQLLERDRIERSFTDGSSILCELSSGNYQMGYGESATIIESVDQVKNFAFVLLPGGKKLVDEIQDWLNAGGVNRARIEKRDLIIAAQAAKQPGTVDAMLDQIGDPALKGQIVEMLAEALRKSHVPKNVLAEVDGGVIVAGEGGGREFIPDEATMDDVLTRELELDQAEQSGGAAGVGGEESADTLADQIAQATAATTKSAQGKASKKGR